MNNAKKYFDVNTLYCWDCGKKLEVQENGDVPQGVMLEIKAGTEGTPSIVFKCKDCYKTSDKVKISQNCEVYSRVVGYMRPVSQWNEGKQKEFQSRKEFKI